MYLIEIWFSCHSVPPSIIYWYLWDELSIFSVEFFMVKNYFLDAVGRQIVTGKNHENPLRFLLCCVETKAMWLTDILKSRRGTPEPLQLPIFRLRYESRSLASIKTNLVLDFCPESWSISDFYCRLSDTPPRQTDCCSCHCNAPWGPLSSYSWTGQNWDLSFFWFRAICVDECCYRRPIEGILVSAKAPVSRMISISRQLTDALYSNDLIAG